MAELPSERHLTAEASDRAEAGDGEGPGAARRLKDPQTILKCYQSADEESMREALDERRVLRGAVGH
jgi:hypothetical protein